MDQLDKIQKPFVNSILQEEVIIINNKEKSTKQINVLKVSKSKVHIMTVVYY